jgi:hypothetical protein
VVIRSPKLVVDEQVRASERVPDAAVIAGLLAPSG